FSAQLKMRHFLTFFVALSIAGATLMDELVGQNEGKWRLKSHNGRYLSAYMKVAIFANFPYTTPDDMGKDQQWTIVKVKDTEVAFKASNGQFIRHTLMGGTDLVWNADEWEMWIPVKNGGGTWSFRSRNGKWLSAYRWNKVELQPE
ncbi:hypothetical protein PRIPAC_72847, partial [Pristionchus pacificus]